MFKSLQARILFYSLIIASLPVLILGVISYESQRALLAKEAKHVLNSGSLNIVNEMYNYLNERISDVNSLSSNSVLINPDSSAEEKTEELKRFTEAKGQYYGAVFVDLEGKVVADTSNKVVGASLADRIWFKESLKGEGFLSDVYNTKAFSEPIIALSAPVNDKKGEMIGIVSPAFRLSKLWQMMEHRASGISDKYPVNFYMINQDGIMISDNDPHGVNDKATLEDMGLTKEQLLESAKSEDLFSAENGEKIYSIQYVHTIAHTENKWFVVVGADKKQVYQPLNDLLSRYLSIYTFVLIVIIIGVYVFTKSLVKPVHDLVDATEDFIQGKEFVVPDKKSFEEMEKLNHAFQRMMDTIKDREREIVRTEKLKYVGQLAAGVAHEIRNPLTTIKGFIQLLKNQDYEKELIEKYSDVMLGEVERVNVFVTQLLDLAKPHQLELDSLELRGFIEDLVSVYSASNINPDVTIKHSLNERIYTYTDKNRLRQVILNVLNNSCESLDSKGEIDITVNTTPYYVQLKIRDNGKGIKPEDLKHIGMPFYTTKAKGNGLGVATCIQIMDELKGKFHITSIYGQGTEVILTIPTTNRLL